MQETIRIILFPVETQVEENEFSTLKKVEAEDETCLVPYFSKLFRSLLCLN